MTRAETILSEIAPLLPDAHHEIRRIPEIVEKCEGPAYTIDREAEGADKAQRAINSMIDHLESQVPPSKMVYYAVLLVRASPSLLLREVSDIQKRVHAFAGEELYRFQILRDEYSLVENRVSLSLVYWLINKG